jgi:hypothetical protein
MGLRDNEGGPVDLHRNSKHNRCHGVVVRALEVLHLEISFHAGGRLEYAGPVVFELAVLEEGCQEVRLAEVVALLEVLVPPIQVATSLARRRRRVRRRQRRGAGAARALLRHGGERDVEIRVVVVQSVERVDHDRDVVAPVVHGEPRLGDVDVAHVAGAGLAVAAAPAVGSLHCQHRLAVHVHLELVVVGLGPPLHAEVHVQSLGLLEMESGNAPLPLRRLAAALQVLLEVVADVRVGLGPEPASRALEVPLRSWAER